MDTEPSPCCTGIHRHRAVAGDEHLVRRQPCASGCDADASRAAYLIQTPAGDASGRTVGRSFEYVNTLGGMP